MKDHSRLTFQRAEMFDAEPIVGDDIITPAGTQVFIQWMWLIPTGRQILGLEVINGRFTGRQVKVEIASGVPVKIVWPF